MTIEKFTEVKLEEAIIQLLEDQGYPYTRGTDLERESSDVLIRSDLQEFLRKRYAADNITDGEIDSIIRKMDALNAADLYDSNKTVCKWVSDGFLLKRVVAFRSAKECAQRSFAERKATVFRRDACR